MEFIASKADLQRELSVVYGVVEKKGMMPVLQFFRITSIGKDAIEIVSTDLDITLTTRCRAQVLKQGTMLIHAIKLMEIVKNLPDADIHISRNNLDWCELQCARSKFRIAGKPEDTFPHIQEMQETDLSISADIFRYLIEYTIIAISKEESQKYALAGAKLIIKGDTVRMVATDGHRLSFVERRALMAGSKEEQSALIPLKTLSELLKLCSNVDPKTEEKVVYFSTQDSHLYFSIGERLLISRTLSGAFPNYELVLPKESKLVITAEKEMFAAAVKRVSLMSDVRCRGVKFYFGEGRCEIVANNSEIGEAREVISIEYSGPQFDIGFNAEYLLDYLDVCDTPETTISFKETTSQALFQPKGDTPFDYKYVAMPMRI